MTGCREFDESVASNETCTSSEKNFHEFLEIYDKFFVFLRDKYIENLRKGKIFPYLCAEIVHLYE
jgi:hypothetical protein